MEHTEPKVKIKLDDPPREYSVEEATEIKHMTSEQEQQASKLAFRAELENLINKHCMENGSDTPDFILADYLNRCLQNFDKTLNRRRHWYGGDNKK